MMTKSCATFPVNKSRVEKVTLPPASQWRVATEDVLITGKLTSTIRRKTVLFTRTSPVKHRQITVTKQGYMIVYDSEERGYVICLKDALKMKTSTMALMKKQPGTDYDWGGFFNGVKCTQIEVKMRWGSILLSVLSCEAIAWIQAFNKFAGGAEKSLQMAAASPPVEVATMAEEDSTSEASYSNFAIPRKETKKNDDRPATFLSCPHLAISSGFSPWRRPASPLPPTTSISDPTADFSIRQGQHSVATLRKILERKAVLSLQSSKRRQTIHG